MHSAKRGTFSFRRKKSREAPLHEVFICFIPETLALDGDPLDVLVITQYAIQSKTTVLCKPIGVLYMEDEKGIDEKIIAVPVANVDKMYKNINDLGDVMLHQLEEIKYFFKTYKNLEKYKWTNVLDFKSAYYAENIINKYKKDYMEMKFKK